MSGQRQKHPDALAFKRGGRYQPLAVLGAPAEPKAPPLPKGTLPMMRKLWRDLWASPLAAVFKPTDVPTLRRWLWYSEQFARISIEVESEPLTVYSGRGSSTINPKWRALKQCEAALRDIERAFGMDALARLRLGITLADGRAKANALREPVRPEAMA